MDKVKIAKKRLNALRTTYNIFGRNDLAKFWLFEEHRCIDKWVHYFDVYEKWFSSYRDKDIIFVEVGVQNGGSLQMWKDYFSKGTKIIGIDISQSCKQFEEERVTVEVGNQEDPAFWSAFKEKYPRVDILLDDGGHFMGQQIVTFREMFQHIKDGGLYICEDCHTSYWQEFNAGVKQKGTYVEFVKNLIDELNAFHARGEIPITENTTSIKGIHFYDSMVVIEKQKVTKPFSLRLGNSALVQPFDDIIF